MENTEAVMGGRNVARVEIEKDCIFEHEGRKFESGGAFISPTHIIAYPRANGILGDWHGNPIGRWRAVSTWKTPRSHISGEMNQIEAVVDGITYTGRGAGEGMIFKGKAKKHREGALMNNTNTDTTKGKQTMTTQTEPTLNKAQRRQQWLDAHYRRCEALARELGHESPNGKKISIALLRLERRAHNAATAQCNGEAYNGEPYRQDHGWESFKQRIQLEVERALSGGKTWEECAAIPGFFVNSDARGYALKIDNDNAEGKALIDTCRLHTDWGGYGILSPDLDLQG